ncbi:MAG: NAD(P)/FAD-dependent oxidoreductase [Proteobacteria bacterium]|nr:NAD(P)/FAD-dependent oxidoreductase [Pseudomonadota bacterium]
MDDCDIAVIGAGPYGLAAAAHLRAAGLATRVFGDPMGFWRDNMPKGMRLRSSWPASHISDPARRYSLDAYAPERGIARADMLPLDEFVRYGEWFKAKAVGEVDSRKVTRIAPTQDGFRLLVDDGIVNARRVVIATGLARQEFRPAPFVGLPAELVSHACEHADLGRWRGRRVAVIGRGQSACESATLLSENGAEVDLVCRGDIHWIGSQDPNSVEVGDWYWRLHKFLAAPSGVGPSPIGWVNEAPGFVRHLPLPIRARLAKLSLRPGATAWLKPRFGGVNVVSGRAIRAAGIAEGRVAVTLDDGVLAYDHVLLATGYRIDVATMGLFAPPVVERIARIDGAPALGRGCESSLPGLHFVGASAVKSYGALMRFVAGCGYAAGEVTRAVMAARTRTAAARPRAPRNTFSERAPSTTR